MENNIFSLNSNENNYEIRCPICYYYVSLSQNPKNNKLIIKCQNCKEREISVEEFYDKIKNNNKKTCNFCLKSFEIKDLFVNNRYNNDSFLCRKCLYELKNNDKINESDYSYVKDLGKNCQKHGGTKNNYFCLSCNKNICKECKNEHINHDIKDIFKEMKNKKEIERYKNIIIEEELNLKIEKKMYDNIILNMSKRFEKIKKNNEDILALKKIIFDIYDSNSNNYEVYKYTNIITNNKKYGLDDKELNEIENLVKNISLNNNSDSEENDFGKTYSKSVTKLPKKNQIHNINLGDNKSNINKNNSICKRDDHGTKSTIKYNKNKNKRKTFLMCNDMINRDIQNRTSFSNINLNVQKNNIKEDFQILKKLLNSIIIMLYLGNNKILISIYSQKNDLILGEIRRGKNINKEDLISLETLPVSKNFNRYINYMELCEDGSIISCSDEQLVKFVLNNKVIDIKFYDIFEKEERPIISCISLSSGNILALSGLNKLHFYMNMANNDKIEKNVYEIEEHKIYSLHKLTQNYIILVGKKNNKNGLYLLVMKINKNEITSLFDRELNINEKEKIYIQGIFEGYAAISYPNKGFFIYDYTKNHIEYNIACDYILTMKMEILNENNIYCYLVVTKYNESRNIEEMKLKKYLIKKQYISRNIEFTSLENKSISLSHKNKINDMIIINEKNNSENKKIILLGDNAGNILYNYC